MPVMTSGRCCALRSWLTVSLLLVFQSADAQSKSDRALHSVGPNEESVCLLAPVHLDSGVRNVPSPGRNAKALGPTSSFSTQFVDQDASDPWPEEAREAFDYATAIWAGTLVSSQEIRVSAYWADRGGCSAAPVSLGSAGARALHRDHPALPMPDTWYVDALADALTGIDLSGSYEPDIRVFLNRDCDDPEATSRWYFGTDGNPPAGHIDFVTVVLHEIGHGLGISGAGRVSSGEGTVRYSSRPYVFDRFTADGTMGASPLLNYPDFSQELAQALQSGSGGVLYDGARAANANGGRAPDLYAPHSWVAGSSYSHLDEQQYNGTSSALMTPLLATMEANHIVGPVTCGLLEDMGWTVSSGACDISLPVELVDVTALVDGRDVILRWITVSELDNLGFFVEHRQSDGDFAPVTFVEGAGITSSRTEYEARLPDLPQGRHAFRLRQVDVDGGATFSDVVEVAVDGPEVFDVTAAYPNPFRDRARFVVSTDRTQFVEVDLVDMLGRSVATLFSDLLPSGTSRELWIEAGHLPAGVYVYRARGEASAVTRTVLLVR